VQQALWKYVSEVRALRQRQARVRGVGHASDVHKCGITSVEAPEEEETSDRLTLGCSYHDPHLNAWLRCAALSSAAVSYDKAKYNAPVRYRQDSAGSTGSVEQDDDGGSGR
jgi:hypothetical protein